MKKHHFYIEIANYYLEKFRKKENFYYHLKNFINEDVKEWNTKPPKNVDAICYYGWKIYSSLKNEEDKKNFIYALFCMFHKVIEAFRNMKLVEVKKILTTVKVNEEIFKDNYMVFDEDNFKFIIYDRNNKRIWEITNYDEVVNLCKYFKIPIGGVNYEMENSDAWNIVSDIDNNK